VRVSGDSRIVEKETDVDKNELIGRMKKMANGDNIDGMSDALRQGAKMLEERGSVLSKEELDKLAVSMDGAKWAQAFCKSTGFGDEDLVRGWFQNALATGHDDGYNAGIAEAEDGGWQRITPESGEATDTESGSTAVKSATTASTPTPGGE
jgi:hypothetical protein